MLNIEESAANNPLPALLRLAFRPLFLGGSVFSALAMLLWIAMLNGIVDLDPYGNSLLWHSHEMLFGFVAAIVIGFLLTAVQNWTGITGLKGKPLFILVAFWITARLLMLQDQWPLITAFIDLLFLPLGAFFLARPLVAIRQYRNLIFLPVLLLMTVANLLFHYGALNNHTDISQQGLHLMLWTVVLLMTILGGRVIPFFTANGTKTPKAEPIQALEIAVIITTLIATLSIGLKLYIPPFWFSLLLIIAGLLHLIRCVRWRPWITLSVPLLWSLHAAYLFIPLGLFATAYSLNSADLSQSSAMHLLSAGAMGCMIISMMARVSLGHTGRALQPAKIMSLAFITVISAALVRVLGAWFFPEHITSSWFIAGSLWSLGFILFAIIYWPILSQPRADGRNG